MNNLRNKKLAIAFLSVGAAAIWVPMLRSSEREVRHRSDTRTGAESQVEGRTPYLDTGSRPELPDGASKVDSERDLAAMLSFLPTGSPSSLEEAAMVWAHESSGPRPPRPIQLSPLLDERPEGGASRDRALEEESLAQYLGDRSLTGILHGASGSLALLGGHTVREGDVLVDGVLTVDEITPTHVTLSYRGDRVRLSLPGFRAAPRAVVHAADTEREPEIATDGEAVGTAEGAVAPVDEEDPR